MLQSERRRTRAKPYSRTEIMQVEVISPIETKVNDGILPNNSIGLTLGQMIGLKKKLGKDLFRHVARIIEADAHPNILMGAMEFGSLYIQGETITAKVGGLAVVVNDMIMNFPRFLEKRGRGKISFAFMAYDGIPQCSYVKSFGFWIGHRHETVEVYRYQHDCGATLYFIDHPLFKRRTLRDPSRNLYSPYPGELYSGREEWEEAFCLGLYNRAIAAIAGMIEANIYHAHDYHTGLAALYLPKNVIKALTIHNAGPGYQGTYWVKDFGGIRNPHPHYQYGIPGGDWRANDHLLSILGVDFDSYMRYFEQNGQFNTLKVIRAIEEDNLVAAIPVSDGYARELEMSPEEIFRTIHLQKGHGALYCEHVYIPNGGLKLGLLKGIENGLADGVHAKNHPFLRAKKEVDIAHIHPAINNLVDRRAWLDGFNFGADLHSSEGIEQVHHTKARLKEILQRNAGLEINPYKPVFVLVSRLVSQKNVSIFAHNIEHIVAHGGQVVIGGQSGDDDGHRVVGHLEYLQNLPHLKGQVRFYNQFINKEIAALIQAGGDFFVITSKFEPCGLTDIEAAWLGTIPVCRKTGGLGKVKNGLYYHWSDSSDSWGEVHSLRQTLDQAISLYNTRPEEFKKMRIGGLKEDFSWNKALSRYFEYYRSSSCYKLVKELNAQVERGLNPYLAKDKLKHVFSLFPADLVESFQKLLEQKNDLTIFEKMIVKSNFFPVEIPEKRKSEKVREKELELA